jgi:hypothetical protein
MRYYAFATTTEIGLAVFTLWWCSSLWPAIRRYNVTAVQPQPTAWLLNYMNCLLQEVGVKLTRNLPRNDHNKMHSQHHNIFGISRIQYNLCTTATLPPAEATIWIDFHKKKGWNWPENCQEMATTRYNNFSPNYSIHADLSIWSIPSDPSWRLYPINSFQG